MAGRDDAIALISEIDGLNTPNLWLFHTQIQDKSTYPPVLNVGNKPSYFDAPADDLEKAYKAAFLFALKQYSYRIQGN